MYILATNWFWKANKYFILAKSDNYLGFYFFHKKSEKKCSKPIILYTIIFWIFVFQVENSHGYYEIEKQVVNLGIEGFWCTKYILRLRAVSNLIRKNILNLPKYLNFKVQLNIL